MIPNIDSKNGEVNSVNFLQVLPGGHCMYCHQDYTEEGSQHPCFYPINVLKVPTPCTDACSKKYSLTGNTIEGKLDYIIQLLEKRK